MEWTGRRDFTDPYFSLRSHVDVGDCGVLTGEGESSAPQEKCWGSIFDTSFTVWGSGSPGGGGGGESFTRLTLSCLQSEGR